MGMVHDVSGLHIIFDNCCTVSTLCKHSDMMPLSIPQWHCTCKLHHCEKLDRFVYIKPNTRTWEFTAISHTSEPCAFAMRISMLAQSTLVWVRAAANLTEKYQIMRIMWIPANKHKNKLAQWYNIIETISHLLQSPMSSSQLHFQIMQNISATDGEHNQAKFGEVPQILNNSRTT